MLTPTNHIALVHRHALAAALAASGASAVPFGLGSMLDVAGLDRVRHIQSRMLRSLADKGFSITGARKPCGRTASGIELKRYARQICEGLAKGPLKRRLASILGRRASSAVPLAGALLVAVMTYRETWLIGNICLSRSPD